jgi:hypothetical protein
MGLKLIRTRQLLVCADDLNMFGDNVGFVKKKKETVIDAG